MNIATRALSAIWTVWSFVLVIYGVQWVMDEPLTWHLVLSSAAGVTLMNLIYVALHKAATDK